MIKNDLLTNIMMASNAKTRSISPENFTGEKGKACMSEEGTGKLPARDLGIGWKVSPSVIVKPNQKFVLADIKEQGVITHIWCTCHPDKWRSTLLRMYWDNNENPSVQTPLGDFFCHGWNERSLLNSLAVTVNPAGGFNSYFKMPFKERAVLEIENLSNEDLVIYYQIDYMITEVPKEALYFHALWKRSNPVKYKETHWLVDDIKGKGQYVGTYLAWQVNNNHWWGEGEIKFYMDDDDKFPTISSTGTEDYFGGAWNFEHPHGQYCIYSTAYQGLHQVIKPDTLYKVNMRFGMYRWHLNDPIYFDKNLRVEIQALGWRSKGRYLPLQDDIASVTYWYCDQIYKGEVISTNYDDLEVI